MITLTCAQRGALKAVFDRQPLFHTMTETLLLRGTFSPKYQDFLPMNYRTFRKKVVPGPGCIMVPWCGMWLGIEPDGYTHS